MLVKSRPGRRANRRRQTDDRPPWTTGFEDRGRGGDRKLAVKQQQKSLVKFIITNQHED